MGLLIQSMIMTTRYTVEAMAFYGERTKANVGFAVTITRMRFLEITRQEELMETKSSVEPIPRKKQLTLISKLLLIIGDTLS